MREARLARDVHVGIVGTGAIGSEIARAAAALQGVTAVFLHDVDAKAARRVKKAVPKATVVDDLADVLAKSDLIVEAASVEAARLVVPAALQAGDDVLMMSIGALVDEDFLGQVTDLAVRHKARVHLPSGAIGGIDALSAAAVGGLKSVTLVTTKPPTNLGLNVDQWTVVFEGSAREAIKRFPQNVNVAVSVSLAGLGPDETKVQVVADPLATHNQHKLIVEGDFGRLRLELENLPHPDNPKSSYLAPLSAIATLRRLLAPVLVS